jgi:hypothetical protein
MATIADRGTHIFLPATSKGKLPLGRHVRIVLGDIDTGTRVLYQDRQFNRFVCFKGKRLDFDEAVRAGAQIL